MPCDALIKELEEKLCCMLSNSKKELNHGIKTREWLLKLYPNATWELQIAALAHDIERAVPHIPNVTPPLVMKKKEESYITYKKRHAKRSATIVKDVMSTLLFHTNDLERVYKAISYHDTPKLVNNADAIAISDADSVRFFDTGLTRYIKSYGIEGAKAKSKFMYERVSKVAKSAIDKINFNTQIKNYLSS